MLKLAEEKKANVKGTIAQLRDQFKKLINKNKELPEHLRLDRKVILNFTLLIQEANLFGVR